MDTILEQLGRARVLRATRATANRLVKLTAAGTTTRVLPGCYALTPVAGDFLTRLEALALYRPDAVLVGETAARVSYRLQLHGRGEVHFSGRFRGGASGFNPVGHRIPDELIAEGSWCRYTVPALTALDLTTPDDADEIDEVLRRGACTLPQLRAAYDLCRGRLGQPGRLLVLDDSIDEPWSAAERLAHRLLRRAGLSGWGTNCSAPNGSGGRFFIDITFPGPRLAIEIDGYQFHRSVTDLDRDDARQNLLVLDGWMVLRFTWHDLIERPALVRDQIQQALAILERR